MELVLLLILCTTFCLFYSILNLAVGARVKVNDRVAVMAGEVRRNTERKTPMRVKRAARTTWLLKLDDVLKRAEVNMAAREFIIRWGMVTLCVAIVLHLAAGLFGSVLTICISGFGTLMYLRLRAGRRTKRFNEGLNDMLTILINSLRAGHSFVQAIHLVGQDLSGPIQEELIRIEAEMQLGVGLEEALTRANERVGSEDFDLIVTAISIQKQIGGNLAEVLEKISETIRDRIRLHREVKALTSQGRLSAAIFMVMPPGVGLVLYVMNPAYIGVLFTTAIGIALIVLAAIGQCIGYFFIRRIVNVEL